MEFTCCEGRVNDITTLVLGDTGSTTCVVKSSLVKPEQMTGSYELCMLIDGVVKRYPTTVVELDTPYYTGTAKVLCMDTPVQDVIIGNIQDAQSPDTIKRSMSTPSVNDGKQPGKVNLEINEVSEQEGNQMGDGEVTVNECAAVQTRAMAVKEKKPPKPLKVNSVPGLDIGPDELKTKQEEDVSLKKYWELVDKPVENHSSS